MIITFNSIEDIENSIFVEENKNFNPNSDFKHMNDFKWQVCKTKGNIFGCTYKLSENNEQEIIVDIDRNMFYSLIAERIVDDIVSCRHGEMYDDEIRDMFVNDYMEKYLDSIRSFVDFFMHNNNYLEEDNLTIK